VKGRTLGRLSEASGGDVAAAAAADVAAVFAAAAVAYKDAAAAAVDVVALNGEAVGPLPLKAGLASHMPCRAHG